jgi:hypothetical protein
MEISWEDIVKQAKTMEEGVFKNKGELGAVTARDLNGGEDKRMGRKGRKEKD